MVEGRGQGSWLLGRDRLGGLRLNVEFLGEDWG